MGLILDDILKNAKWKGQDAFPSNELLENECEKWLVYLNNKGWLSEYMPRLIKMDTKKRDEVLSEISSAYFLEEICGIPVKEVEQEGINNKRGDFIVSVDSMDVFCEVKSPGWEADIVKEQGPKSERLKMPKYINAETRSVGNSDAIRYAIEDAYEKLPEDMPNLLIINDDLWFSILDEPVDDGMPLSVNNALFYKPLPPPYSDERPQGCFMTDQYRVLSGALFLRVVKYATKDKIIYESMLFLNNNTLHPLPQGLKIKLEAKSR